MKSKNSIADLLKVRRLAELINPKIGIKLAWSRYIIISSNIGLHGPWLSKIRAAPCRTSVTLKCVGEGGIPWRRRAPQNRHKTSLESVYFYKLKHRTPWHLVAEDGGVVWQRRALILLTLFSLCTLFLCICVSLCRCSFFYYIN